MRNGSLIFLSALAAACTGQRLQVGIDGTSGGFAGSGGHLPGAAGGTVGAAGAAGAVTSTGGSVGPAAGGASGGGAGPAGSGGAGGTSTLAGPRFLILPPVDPTGSIHTDRQYNSVVTSASDDGSVLVGTSTLYEAATDLFRSYQFYWTAEAGVVRLDDISPTNHNLDNWAIVSPDGTSLFGMASEQAPVPAAAAPFLDYPYTLYRWTKSGGYQFFTAPWLLDSVRLDFMSQDGTTIVATATVDAYSGGGLEQFRWRPSDGFVSLTSLPRWPADGHYYSQPSGSPTTAFSDDGKVIAGYHETASGTVSTPFIWKDPGTLVELGTLPGFPSCFINVLSRDGTTAYGACYDTTSSAPQTSFRWTAATGMVSIGAGSNYSQTSRDGRVAMGSIGTDTLFRWTVDDGAVQLKPPPAVVGTGHYRFTIAEGSLSADGSSLYGSMVDTDFQPGIDEQAPSEAFRWTTTEGFVRLGFLDGNNLSTISAATPDGAVLAGDSANTIGGTNYAPARPAIWDCQGVRSIIDELTAAGIDLQGLRLNDPFRVWSGPDGITIVGYGIAAADSDTRTWIAWLPRRC